MQTIVVYRDIHENRIVVDVMQYSYNLSLINLWARLSWWFDVHIKFLFLTSFG